MKSEVHLLLANDRGIPVLRGGLSARAIERDPALRSPVRGLRTRLREPAGDQSDLQRQNWGLLVPAGAMDRLEALQPLITLREQEGARHKVFVVTRDQAKHVADFVQTEYVSRPIHEQPLCLLLCADFFELSTEFEEHLRAAGARVGRIHFAVRGSKECEQADLDGYRAYAEKIIRFNSEPAGPPPTILLYTARDRTSATAAADAYLSRPALAQMRRLAAANYLSSTIEPLRYESSHGSLDRLLNRLGQGRSVLLSASHGVGASPGWSWSDQRARQGLPILSEDRSLDVGELAKKPFLPGGAWFTTSCLTGGTPTTSAFLPWLRELARLDPPEISEAALASVEACKSTNGTPFIGSTPQASLRNPEGPIVVIAHFDLAWAYGFTYRLSGGIVDRPEPNAFVDAIRSLASGHRAGFALEQIRSNCSAAMQTVTTKINDALLRAQVSKQPIAVPQEAARCRLRALDLGGYVLFGDPAARIR